MIRVRSVFTMSALLVAALVTTFALTYLLFVADAHAVATCVNYYNSSQPVPADFSPPYNVFSTGKELLLRADLCDFGVARLRSGNSGDTDIYTWHTGYYWANSQWNAFEFDGKNPMANSWFRGLATGVPTVTSPGTYVVAYTCRLLSLTDWRCGCSTSECLEANGEGKEWSLQHIQTNQVCASPPCHAPTMKYDHTDNSCNSCKYTNCSASKLDIPGITRSMVEGTSCWTINSSSTSAYECYIHTPTSVNNVWWFECKL